MGNGVVASGPYEVAVDHGTLRGREMARQGRGFTVKLTGPVDKSWANAFRALGADDARFSGFHLDSANQSVSFTCSSDEGAVAIISTLDALDSLISRVNRNAAILAAR